MNQDWIADKSKAGRDDESFPTKSRHKTLYRQLLGPLASISQT